MASTTGNGAVQGPDRFATATAAADDREGVALSSVLRVLRRRWWAILLCVVVGAGAATVLTRLQTKQYQATSALLFRDLGLQQEVFGSATPPPAQTAQDAATNLQLVQLNDVATATAGAMTRQGEAISASTVRSAVTVSSTGQSNITNITATASSPKLATDLANAYARQFITIRRRDDRSQLLDAKRLVQSQLAQVSGKSGPYATQRANAIRQRAQDLNLLASLQTGGAELAQMAVLPGSPSSPKPVQNAVIGGFVGLLVGLALALSLDQIDRRFRHLGEVEEMFGLPVLGRVPQSKSLARGSTIADALAAPEVEAFRIITANLRFVDRGVRLKSLLLTSPAPGDGKSTIALNLARTAAANGSRVLLVEADLRRPQFAARLGIDAKVGLMNSLMNGGTEVEATRVRLHTRAGEDPESSFDIVVAGPPAANPGKALASEEMRRLVERMEREYDLVIFDAPPLAVVSDAFPLINLVSGVVIVTRLGTTTRGAAERLRTQLQQLNAPVIGVIANSVSEGLPDYGRYHMGSAAAAG